MRLTPMIAVAALAFVATPALADDSPAEIFGKQHAGGPASAAALEMAIQKIERESPAERILRQDEIATRGVTIGDRQLAASLGVNANDYSSAELSRMIIDKYD